MRGVREGWGALLLLTSVTGEIYCKVGYGQRIDKDNRDMGLYREKGMEITIGTQWFRRCTDQANQFCFEASTSSANKIRDLVGGEWDDSFWKAGRFFVKGCGGDFGFQEMSCKKSLVALTRGNEAEETGVSAVLTKTNNYAEGVTHTFKVTDCCTQNHPELTCAGLSPHRKPFATALVRVR